MISTPEFVRCSPRLAGPLAALALVLAVPGAAANTAQGELLARASAALARGDGIAAEADLRRLLAQGAAREVVAARMGEALIQQSERRKAREWLAPGRFAKSDEGYGWRMLGLLERLDGDLPAAGRAYDQALKVAPKDSQLWVDIGRLRYVGGEQLQAIDAAEQAVEFGPENIHALEFRAQLIRDRFGLEAALPWYEAALVRAPGDPDLLVGYAATLGELGRARDMLEVLRKLLDQAPQHPMGLYLQAVLAARAGETELARSVLNRVKGRLDDMPAAQLLRGALELEAGNAVYAREVLDRLVRRQPANRRAQLLLARALYDAGAHRELLDRFASMAARADAPPYLLLLLARAHEEQGDRLAAAPLLDRVAATGSPPLVAIGDYAVARDGAAEGFTQAGDLLLGARRADAALERYAMAARIRFPESLLLRIGAANAASGRDAANPGLTFGYLAANPSSRLAVRLGAGYAAIGGDWARSAVLLESLRLRGGARDVRLLADLSLAQLRSGDRIAALETARRAYQLQRASPIATQAYAMALIANAESLPLAAELIAKARLIDGDNPLLTEARKQLAAARAR